MKRIERSRRLLRSALLLAVAVSVPVTGLRAQQQFRSTTSLLTLDVSVLDQDGNPVTDLSPDDFVVTLNKEARPVRAMVFLANQTTRTSETVRAVSPGLPTPPSASAPSEANREPDPKLLVILVDDLSIYPTESKGLFVAAERFIGTIPTRDWVGLASTSGRLTVNTSLDRAPLLTKLKGAFGWMNDPRRESQPYIGLMDALDVDMGSQASLRNVLETSCGLSPNLIGGMNLAEVLTRYGCASDVERQARNTARFARRATENQLAAYIAIIKAMASAPGVKQLVILTGGVALKPSESRDFVPVAQAASAAGVQMSILMEEPDDVDVGNPNAGAMAQDQRRMLQQAQALAEVSGGQFFRVVGQADRFYQRVLTSASAIYRLGVDLPASVPQDGNYQVEVTVNRPRVRVLASRHAVPPPPPVPPPASSRPEAAVTPAMETTAAKPAETAPMSEAARLLARATEYLESYEQAFAVVVAEETYLQEMHRQPPTSEFSTRPRDTSRDAPLDFVRTLRSDVLQASIGQREWAAFRDVYEVDGHVVRDRDERLQNLFINVASAPPQALEQARRIVAESARFNLGALRRDFNMPTMALTFLRQSNHARSEFAIAGHKDVDGVPAVILEFKERATPTIIRSADADLSASGRFWIEAESGRVLKSELVVADRRSKGKITVTYGAVPTLTVWVPILMTEEYTGLETIFTKASYSNFRQFEVSVGRVIK